MSATRVVFALIAAISVFSKLVIAQSGDSSTVHALTNALILSQSDQGEFIGTVIVKDGIIAAVGPQVEIPADATTIDLSGFTLAPGLIDSRSVLWLTPKAIKEQSSTAALDVVDGINPWQEDWREVIRQGVTTVYVQPNQQGTLGGRGAVLRVAPDLSGEDLVLEKSAAVQAAIGVSGATSRDRFAQYEKLKKSIKAAIDGKDAEDSDEGNSSRARGARGGRSGAPGRSAGNRGNRGGSTSTAVTPPDRTKELLTEVVESELPLRIEVHLSDSVKWALALANEFDIPVILDRVRDPGSQTESVVASNLPLVLGPFVDVSTTQVERTEPQSRNLNRLLDGSAIWAIGTYGDSPRDSQMLRVQAAAAIAHGASRQRALRAVTIDAARLLGVADRIGSIEVGKLADIAVFAGDPLNPAVPVRLVMSQGNLVFESNLTSRPEREVTFQQLPNRLPESYIVKTNRLLVDGEYLPGSFRVNDGKVVEVGARLSAGDEVETFDLGDTIVTPGLVVAHSTLGQSASLDDSTESDASHFRSVDVIDTTWTSMDAMVAGGFTDIHFAPSSSNTSAGVTAHLKPGSQNKIANAELAQKFVLTEDARNRERYPASLAAQIEVLDSLFAGDTPDTRLYVTSVIKQNLLSQRFANIQAVTQGDRPAIFAIGSEVELEAALQLAKNFDLRGGLFGTVEDERSLQLIRDADWGLVIPPVQGDEYQTHFAPLAGDAMSELNLGFAGETPEQIRVTMSMAVNAGMPEKTALRGITTAAAKISGMAPGTGRILAERPATFVVWTGSPVDLRSRPSCVVVDGNVLRK